MQNDKGEIKPLTGLRGIAALCVAFGHYQIGPLLVPDMPRTLGWWSTTPVDLFFCLSGFTLGLAYSAGTKSSLPLRSFLVARIARIYPLYFLTFFLCIFIIEQRPDRSHLDFIFAVREYIAH